VALTIGIVGLPNVGKSTMFNALTRAQVLAANYPFATIEPNVGVVPLPDSRLKVLAGIFGSERILPATVSFVDIAGIVKGASEGEGLGNKFLATIREADAICQVTRAFVNDDANKLHDQVNDLDTFGIYSPEQIEEFVSRCLDGESRDRLDPLLDTSVAEYIELPDEDDQMISSAMRRHSCVPITSSPRSCPTAVVSGKSV